MNSYNISHQESELNYMEMNKITHSSGIMDQAVLGKDITNVVFAILHQYGRMSISDAFNKVITMCDKAAMDFPELDKRNFLQSYPSLFSVNDSDYVATVEEESALELKIDTVEGTVAALLQVFFQDVPEIHISLLKESFCCFCSSMKENLLQLQPAQQLDYFSKNPAFVVDENDGLVEAIFMYRSSIKNVQKYVAFRDLEKLKKILSNKLKKDSVCHYVTLLDTVLCSNNGTSKLKKFIERLSDLEKLWFFRNRPLYYFVSDDGFVRKAHPVSQKIVDFFLSVLERRGSIHCSEVVGILSNSTCEFNEFFKFHSKKQIIDFFRSRTTSFSVSEDFNIQPVQPLNTAKSKTVILNIYALPPPYSSYQNFEYGNQFEQEAVYGLLSILGLKRMKHDNLLQKSFKIFPSVLRFFEGYSSADESLFFRMKNYFFNYESESGFVSAAANVVLPESCGTRKHAKQKNAVTDYTGVNVKILKERFFDIFLPWKVYQILNETDNKSMNAKRLLELSKESGQYFRYFLVSVSWETFCSKLKPNIFSVVDDY